MDMRNEELAVVVIMSRLLMLQITELLSQRYPEPQQSEAGQR